MTKSGALGVGSVGKSMYLEAWMELALAASSPLQTISLNTTTAGGTSPALTRCTAAMCCMHAR